MTVEMKCQDCWGRGSSPIPGSSSDDYHQNTCQSCFGRGYVLREVRNKKPVCKPGVKQRSNRIKTY